MDFIPDWAPNLHPMIIHFPIALWMVAVLFDFSLVFRTKEWLRRAAIWMYVIGAISALAAFLSGSQAIDLVSVPMQGEVTASKHSDWAHYTLYYLGGYALLRLFIFWQRLDKKKMGADPSVHTWCNGHGAGCQNSRSGRKAGL
jgi:uncharacterized membrane protein